MQLSTFINLSVLSLSFVGVAIPPLPANSAVGDYWSTGLAEISRYELKQARYGAIHKGEAILLFVTEPFTPSAQVKDESGKAPDAVPVLKLNAYRRFATGIYDYSIMSSVFSSMDSLRQVPTFKVTTSVQDWCGQVFNQWNHRDTAWSVELRSYFQNDGDVNLTLPLVPLEDGIWNRLRLDPESLPTGALEMIPGSAYLRLKHKPLSAYGVEASLSGPGRKIRSYQLNYPELKRTLTIQFTASAPYEIVSWTESYPDRGDEILTTEALRTHRIRSYYWEKNQPGDLALRKKLGL